MFNLLLMLCAVFSGYMAENQFAFNYSNKPLSQFIAQEEALNAEPLSCNSMASIDGEYALGACFLRPQSELPDLKVTYFYFPEDSIVQRVSYEWNANRDATADDNPQSLQKVNLLIAHYTDLENKLVQTFGEAKITGSLDKLENLETRDGLKRTALWKLEDGREIKMYALIRNYFEQKGAVTFKSTYLMRLELK